MKFYGILAPWQFRVVHDDIPASARTLFHDLNELLHLSQDPYVVASVTTKAMESEWLREAIRVSLRAPIFTTSDDEKGPPEQHDPRFYKLVEGIKFSKRFILTYQLVIVGVVCLLSAIHWTEKVIRWRKRRAWNLQKLGVDDIYDNDAETIKPVRTISQNGRQEMEEISSSGSSTIEGTASPPSKIHFDEDTPLLHQGHTLQPLRRTSLLSTMRAFFMYQPRPIPLVNKVLPPNGISIIVLALVALNLFYMFFHINFNVFELFVLADRIGIVFVANLPWLYLLAAKTQPLRFLTGRSYESLNIFHRRLGELLCLQALLHFSGMLGVWFTLFRVRPGTEAPTLIQFLTLRVIWLGLVAFFSYEILFFTSLSSFRQRWYELFLGLHIILQVIALVFVFLHHPIGRPYVGFALGIFLVDRLVYRVGFKSTTIEARTKILEDEETVKVSVTIMIHPSTSLITQTIGRCIARGWKATDHVFMTVPSLSHSHVLQAHPFTIASAAPLPDDTEAQLELIIRAQDGFSRDLLNASRLHKTITVRLDGPYGSSHARHMLESSDLALLVAGGSGIAVCWPLLQHLLVETRSSNTEIAPLSALRRQTVILIWVIHDGTHISWIGRPALQDAEYCGAEIIVPQATEEVGRPDLEALISRVVENHISGQGKRIRIVASGPDSMGRMVRNTCAKMVREGVNADIEVEKFGW